MHAGIFKERFKCNVCEGNENFRKAWGCTGKAQMAIPPFEYLEGDVHFQLWSCPINFIPVSINKFFMIYNYHQEFQSAPMPPLGELSARFYLAYRYYQGRLNEYTEMMQKDK